MVLSGSQGVRPALVTGASRGIGRVIAAALARAGFAVAVNYRASELEAQRLVESVEASGGTAIAIQADISDPAQAIELLCAAEEALGPLHVVVSNAGATRDRLLVQMTGDDWVAMWSTNLAGARALMRRAAAGMCQRGGGRIVSVGSVVGSAGNAGQANYAAAKAALLGLTRELAVSVAGCGVTVNCVVPGYIVTDATAHLTKEQRDQWLGLIPMRRYATPDEVASLVVFLAGDGAAYITGQCIAVDGGLLALRGAGVAS